MNNDLSSEYLHRFLDGDALRPEEEQHLFGDLFEQQELREEMRDSLALRSAIFHDTEAFTPPAEATAAVFAQLGFGNTGLATKETVSPAASWRRWIPLLALFIGLGVGGGGMRLFDNYSMQTSIAFKSSNTSLNSADNATSKFAQQGQGLAQNSGNGDNMQKSPDAYNHAASQRISNQANLTKTAAVEQYSEAQEIAPLSNVGNVDAYTDANENIAANTEEISQLSPINSFSNTNASWNPYSATEAKPLHSTSLFGGYYAKEFPQFWAQVRGVQLLSSSSAVGNTAPLTGSVSDVNIAFGYSFSDNFALGVELGRESFNLRYSGSVNGRKTEFAQNSPMLLGGLVAQGRLNPIQSLGELQPVATLFVGGSEIGMLGRASLGVLLPLSQSFSLYGGLDYSLMNYQFQNNSFSTDKIGGTYGLLVNF